MADAFKELRKYALIWLIFIKNCLIGQLEYRANFITGLAMEGGYLFAKMLYIIVIYRAGVSINGLSPDEILVFVGTYVIVTGFYAGLFMMNLFGISNHIREGTLDLYITKPVSLQFILTLRRSDISLLILDVIAGSVMVIIGWSRLATPISVLNLAGFTGYMLCGTIVGYALFLLPQLLSFWFVNTKAISGTVDSFWDFNNMPMGIYNKLVQRIGVFILPIFVVTNFPALFILGKLSTVYAIWGIAAPIIFMALTRLVWHFAVRRYSSASS